jgi:thiol-disulfide isomerase/thioredoxin
VRCVGVVAVLLVATAPAFADPPPTLDEALAKAARANKPLVLEFSADWCKPCRYFDEKVLTQPEVIAALRSVEFVQYDIDVWPGSSVASRLAVRGVPTFVALDAHGKVTAQHSGTRLDARARTWFLDFLADATGAVPSREKLERAVNANPNDASARLRLAQHYREAGRVEDALEQLGWVTTQADTDPDLAAHAAAERDALEAEDARIKRAIEAAEQFVDSYPASPRSSLRLVALAMSGRVSRDRVHTLASQHLDAVSAADWPNATRAVLAAGHDKVALANVEKRYFGEPKDPVVALMRAEVMLLARRSHEAWWERRDVCRSPGHELWCFLLDQDAHGAKHAAQRLGQLRAQGAKYLQTLSDPTQIDELNLETIGEAEPSLGNVIGLALDGARLGCGYLARPELHVELVLELRTRRVRIEATGNDALEHCIAGAIHRRWVSYVGPPDEGHVHGSILFFTPADQERQYSMPPRVGVLPQLVVRRGDLETYGFRGDFRFGPRRDSMRPWSRTFEWIVGGTLEFAGTDSGEPGYVARAVAGLDISLRWAKQVRISAAVGIGVSDLGTRAPRAFEIPIEDSIRFPIGRARIHVFGTFTRLFGGGRHDEGTFGAGISFPIADRRVFIGAARESRITGETVMVRFGVPLGELY